MRNLFLVLATVLLVVGCESTTEPQAVPDVELEVELGCTFYPSEIDGGYWKCDSASSARQIERIEEAECGCGWQIIWSEYDPDRFYVFKEEVER
jgi:hypothetical protein